MPTFTMSIADELVYCSMSATWSDGGIGAADIVRDRRGAARLNRGSDVLPPPPPPPLACSSIISLRAA